MAVTMARPVLIRIGGVELTDHNRSPLTITSERIEKKVRTANGTLRKYYVADKFSFNVSWEMVPTVSAQTVDGKAGAVTMRNIYMQRTGPVNMDIENRNGTRSTFLVMFSDFTWTVVKRWNREYWNVDMSLEQV